MSINETALEEYRALLTLRMLLYRTVADALSATSREGLTQLEYDLFRIPRDAPRIVADSLKMPSFREFYNTWTEALKSNRDEVERRLNSLMGKRGACSIDNFKQKLGESGRAIAQLSGITVSPESSVNLIGLLEIVYTILGMEYSALEEYNIMPLVALETEFIANSIIPALTGISKCLLNVGDDLGRTLAKLLDEFALTEKNIAEAQKKAVREASGQGKENRIE